MEDDAETANENGHVATAGGPERSAAELTDAELREQAMQHLQSALSATDPADKQFHVREALQLLTIDD